MIEVSNNRFLNQVIDTLLPRLADRELIRALYLDDPEIGVPDSVRQALVEYVDGRVSIDDTKKCLLDLTGR